MTLKFVFVQEGGSQTEVGKGKANCQANQVWNMIMRTIWKLEDLRKQQIDSSVHLWGAFLPPTCVVSRKLVEFSLFMVKETLAASST